MKKCFLSLFVGLFLLCFGLERSSFAVAEDKQVILYIYLFDFSGVHPGDPETLFSEFKGRMSALHPLRSIRKVVATEIDSLKLQLDSVLEEGEAISHLVIRGHGYSFDRSPFRSLGECIASAIQVGPSGMLEFVYPIERRQNIEEGLTEANPYPMSVFSGIRGRFVENPSILITSCKLLEGSPEDAEMKAKAIAHVLGVRDGVLYANWTNGVSLLKFYKNPKVLAVSGVAALLGYWVGDSLKVAVGAGALPMAFLYWRQTCVEAGGENQGYCCTVSNGDLKLVPSTRDEFVKDVFEK